MHVANEIIAKRIQEISAGPNKGRKSGYHFNLVVVWDGCPLKKDYTWEPIDNLYDHEELAETYEKWLQTENERLDSEEAERTTVRQLLGLTLSDLANLCLKVH